MRKAHDGGLQDKTPPGKLTSLTPDSLLPLQGTLTHKYTAYGVNIASQFGFWSARGEAEREGSSGVALAALRGGELSWTLSRGRALNLLWLHQQHLMAGSLNTHQMINKAT